MIMITKRKTLFGKSDGMAEMGRWMLEAGRFRRRGRMAGMSKARWTWVAFFAFLGAVALSVYRRKRRQVADRYSMGEPEGAWGGEQIPTGESIPAR